MIGGVYFLADDDSPFGRHPCVVVLHITGTRECLVVPAFSVGRETVESAIRTLVATGLPRDAIAVTLDNRQHITVRRNIELYEAHWVVAQHRRIDARSLSRGDHLGRLSDDGVRQIIKALLKLADHRPDQFSKPLHKKLQKILRSFKSS